MKHLVRPLVALLCVVVALLPSVSALAADNALPSGVALDHDGNLYITDYGGDRIVKVSSDGTPLARWGAHGTSPGSFSGPSGIAVDDQGAVYVTDQLNNRVQKFSASGSFVQAWGSGGSGPGQLRTPFGLALGRARVYVADFGNDRVQVFSGDGEPLFSWGRRGSAEGQFFRPTGLATDADGNVYVSDHCNNRVQKFTAEGSFLRAFGTAPTESSCTPPAALSTSTSLADSQILRPHGLSVDSDGNIYVVDYGRNRIVKLGPDGRLHATWGTRGSGNGEFLGPKGIVVDARSGRVYVADTGNDRIQRFGTDGAFEDASSMVVLSTGPAL